MRSRSATRIRLALAGAVLGAFTLSASLAHAEKPTLELGAFAGFHFFSDTDEIGNANGRQIDHPADFGLVGIRLGIGFAGYLELEGDLMLIPTKSDAEEVSLLLINYGFNALIFPIARGKFRPFLLGGIGTYNVVSDDESVIYNDTDILFYGGLGAKLGLGTEWGLRFDARLLFPPSTEGDDELTKEFQVLAGLYYSWGAGRTTTKEIVREIPGEIPEDFDNDGKVGDADQCPREAEDFDNFEDDDGCPDNDNDKDGIADADDSCRDEPETVNGIDDTDGCPETDDDGDGLLGSADKCPMEREDPDGFEDEDGCPDTDNDADGIADVNDKCLNEPETANGYEDTDGCPDEVPEKIKKFTGRIEGIKFRTGSHVILRSSYRVLNKAAAVLKEFPDLRVEIQGHTDNVGKQDYNRELSLNRAQSVKDYLVAQGIGEDRLEVKGFGPDQPVDTNKTAAGRAQNRRVEFHLLSGVPVPEESP